MLKQLADMNEAERYDYMHAANAVMRSIVPPGAESLLVVRDIGSSVDFVSASLIPIDRDAAMRFVDSLDGR